MNFKQKAIAVAFGAQAIVLSASVQAATVIDTATKTAITAGFGDLKDTLLDVLTTAFPFVIGASVIMMSPAIVKKLLKMAGH